MQQFFSSAYLVQRILHSFPTRRSSDLWPGVSITCQRPLAVSISTPSHRDRKSTRLNSSHVESSYAVFCLKKKAHLSMGFFFCSKIQYVENYILNTCRHDQLRNKLLLL